jgi:hypothetical protein
VVVTGVKVINLKKYKENMIKFIRICAKALFIIFIIGMAIGMCQTAPIFSIIIIPLALFMVYKIIKMNLDDFIN